MVPAAMPCTSRLPIAVASTGRPALAPRASARRLVEIAVHRTAADDVDGRDGVAGQRSSVPITFTVAQRQRVEDDLAIATGSSVSA